MAKATPVDDCVTCFVSGERVPKSMAVLVKIGPGQRVWMRPEFTQEPRRGRTEPGPPTGRGFPRRGR